MYVFQVNYFFLCLVLTMLSLCLHTFKKLFIELYIIFALWASKYLLNLKVMYVLQNVITVLFYFFCIMIFFLLGSLYDYSLLWTLKLEYNCKGYLSGTQRMLCCIVSCKICFYLAALLNSINLIIKNSLCKWLCWCL